VRVPRKPTISRRLLTSATWPVGVALTSWSYMWRTTPMHRRELEGTWDGSAPPPLPTGSDRSELQGPEQGAGPLLHRRYRARIVEPQLSAREVIARLAADPNRVAPGGLARFQKVHGGGGPLVVGDEFVVRMPGPWDGPVRVLESTPESFRFGTLDGHLEAGQIEWRAEDDDGDLVFTVTSWARSGDRLSDLMHNRLRMAKEVQLHMWTSVLERVAKLAGGRLPDGLDIETRRVDAPAAAATPESSDLR
jgi:hypothetical protein